MGKTVWLCPETGYVPKNADRDEFISDYAQQGWIKAEIVGTERHMGTQTERYPLIESLGLEIFFDTGYGVSPMQLESLLKKSAVFQHKGSAVWAPLKEAEAVTSFSGRSAFLIGIKDVEIKRKTLSRYDIQRAYEKHIGLDFDEGMKRVMQELGL